MIKIETVLPFDSNEYIELDVLSRKFLNRIQQNGNTNPLKRLTEGINSGRLYKVVLNADNIACLRFLKRYYNCLIRGNPKLLQTIRERIHGNGWDQSIYHNGQIQPFGTALLKAFGYINRFRSVEGKGIWLARVLNIKSCPYCNCQYTLFVQISDESRLAKFQFDHFYPKEQFPYFSVSFYNLIPSCASCNHKKSNQPVELDTHYHPYYNEIAPFVRFKVDYPADINKMSFPEIRDMNPEDLTITFENQFAQTQNFIDEHNRLFDITPIYKRHNDIAHQILIQSVLYNRYYQKGTINIKGLFPDKTTMLKYILGNYMKEEEILMRPLSKFTQDLAIQLKLL